LRSALQQDLSARICQAGFVFSFPAIDQALADLLSGLPQKL